MRKIEYIPAIVLAAFLGCIGLHRFYVKDNGIGLLYLLFFWTGIPAIISMIDIAVWVWNGEDEFYNKYTKSGKIWVDGYWRDKK